MKRSLIAMCVLSLLVAACTGSETPPDDPGEPVPAVTGPTAPEVVDAPPIPEGQSLMDPGQYLARTFPEAVITTTSPWYGAANVPGFADFGQLDEFPYAEIFLMNVEDVFADPQHPGEPFDTMLPPDDLFAWFLDTGVETVAGPTDVEIDGYAGQQADIRVTRETECAPEDEQPFEFACLSIFPIGPDVFPFSPGMMYRLIVLPDVEGETVTIMYSDLARNFEERVQVGQEVIDSIDFQTAPAAPIEATTITLGVADPQGRPDTPIVEHFAEVVGELSDGAIAVEIQWAAGGDASEQGVVQRVETGSLDIGWTGARVWDTLGVTSFQALQAPFLITDHEVLNEVLTDPIATEMLAGLEGAGFVGLGLYPDQLRHPLGYADPMVSLDDFDGAAIRLGPSEATDALVRALGGEAAYGLSGEDLDAAIANGDVQGTETSFGLALELAPPGSFMTGNVVWFPRVNGLWTSEATASELSDEQWAILQEAASETFAFASTTVPAGDSVDAFCSGGGEVVAAKAGDLAALERAARPVYRAMEGDPQTASFIARIREIAASSDPASLPTSCEG